MTTAGERRAVLMIIGAAMGFASIALFVLFSTRAGTPLSMVLLGRYSFAAAVLGLWLRRRITPRVVGRGFAPLLIWGGIGQAVAGPCEGQQAVGPALMNLG